MEQPTGRFYLGEYVDPVSHERQGDPVFYSGNQFTTHGVIVGMTGSGKTGLGIVLLEEALAQGIPVLAIDPKGDIGNLLLTFPDLAPADFEPWVNESDARQKGKTVPEFAESTATLWRNGLAGWGIEPERIRTLRESADFTIYTPGSTAGVPLDIVGSLRAPKGNTDIEVLRDEIEGFVSSLLGLVGIQSDPISSREHILLANLIESAWGQGTDLDLERLVVQVMDPPLRKLGVFDLDTFFPPKDRTALAMKLNGLVASPSFQAWTSGPELDPESMLRTADGKPRAAIVTLSHLSEEERQFVVTLLLSRLVTWMRSQPGTSDLRALVYMDEVFGYAPPSAAPPSKKPILTILKQARAFGVGMVLSTQNPVDVDYKAMSNAGTWLIGRLQTERDKARLLEGLRSASGDANLAEIDSTISGLGKREFLLHSTKAPVPRVFGTRWAMSYLRGPLSRDQIATLTVDARAAWAADAARSDQVPTGAGTASGGPPTPAPPATAADETVAMPAVAAGIRAYHVDPAAPWAARVGAVAGGTRFEAGLVARVNLLFDETRADLRHQDEWEAVFFPLGRALDPEKALPVDYDERDLRDHAPAGARYALPDAPIDVKAFFSDAQKALTEHLFRNRSVSVFHNKGLKLYSRVGEDEAGFRARCEQAAEDAEDAEAAKIRDRMEDRMERIRLALSKAEDRVTELDADTRARKQQEIVAGVGSLLTSFLGGRKSSRGLATQIGRMTSRRSQTSRSKTRLESAANRAQEKELELENLENDLADELVELDIKWREIAEAIETVEIGLEKTDIQVDEMALIWVPRAG